MTKRLIPVIAGLLIFTVLSMAGCPTDEPGDDGDNNPKTYTVKFESNGGGAVPSRTVKHGEKITEPAAITKADHAPDGWYKEAAFTTKWNFASDVVTADITLYAKWIPLYTVTFDADGGTPAPEPQSVAYGAKATEPQGLTKGEQIIEGWYKEDTFTAKWNFASDVVTANITLYAKWVVPTVTGISAVYNGTAAIDYTAPIDNLKDDLTVTAQYNNGTSKEVTDYELEGTLAITGTSAINVTLEGETTAFTVTAYAFFTGASAMSAFLETLADNTAATAYNIFLNVMYNPWTSSGQAQTAFRSKYVNLNLGNALTNNIGTGMFRNCTLLVGIAIPANVTSIGANAFNGCTNLAGNVTIPEDITTIGEYTFNGCASLTSVTIPNSVTTIGQGAFSGCASLTGITIPANVTSIGASAFSGCSSLVGSITIPEGVTSIGNNTFQGCASLTSITIPNNVTSIGNYAFYGCASLDGITIPAGVTSIGEHAFNGCANLAGSITIPAGVIGQYTFNGCAKLTSVTIAEGVTNIGESAFNGCADLASVTIPNSVTSIGTTAFRNCASLASVTIPASVTSIGQYTFLGCSSLASVTFAGTNTSLSSGAFPGDLNNKYTGANGGIGTYIVTSGQNDTKVWTKQPSE